MQIIELAFSEYKVNGAYLILTVSFIGIEREDDFMPVLLESLNKLDDIAYKLSANIWLGNSRCKKQRILLIVETEAVLQLLTRTTIGCND